MHRLLVALLLVSGCAYGIDGPDPDRPRSEPPQCDTGKGLVLLDGVMAGVAGLVAISVADDSPGVALLPLGIAALYLGGALKGNRNADRCRAARSDYESYLAARETLEDERRVRPPVQAATIPTSAPPASPSAVPTPTTAAPIASGPVSPTPPPPAMSPPVSSAPAPAPAPPARAPAKPRPTPEPDDDWSAFWREVP
jgi:hypothetical protein